MSSTANKPVKTAIAGLGRAGWNIHGRAIKQRQEQGKRDFDVVAVIDPLDERLKEAEATFPGCKGFKDWKTFLKEKNGAEFIVIATQSVAHGPMSIDALKAGLHVMTEKPMAMSVKEADKMIAAAKKAKRILTIHQNRRTDPDVHHLLHIFKSGILGKVFMIKQYSSHFARRNDWQTLRKFGGGTLNNTCPHTIDQLLLLLESPVKDVWGDLQACVTAGNAEDHVKVLIRGKNGRVIDMEVTSAYAFGQPGWQVMGTLGSLRQEGDEFVIKHLDPKKLKKLKADPSMAVPDRKYGVIGGEQLEWQETRVKAKDPQFAVNFYDRLYDSIRNKKKLFITPESVREQLRVIEMARRGTKFV
ncbi:MAG: Gfo/Idh/MocA family oxidoreductase [Planctomycetota bacterium]|nr:Gfo/Idh/MocA family oxidoreductase [Planctomycetota bacterium]